MKKIAMDHRTALVVISLLACTLGEWAVAGDQGLKTLADLRRPTPNKEVRVYKEVDGHPLTLDLYPVGGSFPTSPLPAIVFFHGGGWGSGSTDHFAAHCRYFASRGMVAVNVSYRLTKSYFPDRPAGTLFDCIADAQDAIRWLRTNAAKFGIDPGRIAAAGDSAGGHLAAATAILPDPRTGKLEPATMPDALVLCNPVLDLVSLSWGRGVAGIREKPETEWKEAARRASPLLNLRSGLPPTLILHGDADACVPVEQARRFQEGMRAAGNRCDAVIYPDVNHAFVLLDLGTDEAVVVRAIADMDRFLAALGYLNGPPTVISTETAPGSNPAMVALANRADAAMAAAGDGVGREYANRLRSEHRPAWLEYFKGKGPKPTWPTQDEARGDIEGLIGLIEAAKTWPAPGEFKIPKAAQAPAIDGNLDDEAWQKAATWTDIYPFNNTAAEGPKTTWRVTWDDQYLYFAFDCDDVDVVAPERKRDEAVYSDDCVEMFILPDFQFRTYWEIVIAPNGSVFDSVECKDVDKWGCNLDPAQDVAGMKHAQTVRGTINKSDDTDEGYTVEVAVPFSALPGYARAAPKPGQRLHFMLVRLDRSNGNFGAYSFRPLQGWGHNIWNHAIMELK